MNSDVSLIESQVSSCVRLKTRLRSEDPRWRAPWPTLSVSSICIWMPAQIAN